MENEERSSDLDVARELASLRARVEALEHELSDLRSVSTPFSHVRPAPPPLLGVPTNPQGPRQITPASSSTKHPSPAPTARRDSASLEARLGSQIFNRIGVLAILIGTAWFLKLAIDNQWIGPAGRVIAGLLAGAGIVLWSEYFRRKSYAVFSYSLKAVGTGILYLTLWAGFQLYHLLPAPAIFTAMLLVTAWNAWMAWAQDAELLAVYALAGGFSTPALLSTGENHPVFLFSYLIVLCGAVIGLLAFKPWQRLLIGAIPATVLYYIGWYSRFYSEDQIAVVSLFTLLLFLLFAAVPFIRPSRESVFFSVYAPLAAGLFGSLAFYSILQDSHLHDWLPWGAVVLAAFYLALLQVQSRIRPNAASAAIHLALAIVLLTIAIPLKASGRWITIGWLVEGCALFWIATARLQDAPDKIRGTLRSLALGALALGYISVLTLPMWIHVAVSPIFNAAFATELTGMAVFAAVIWLCIRSASDRDFYRLLAAIFAGGLNLLILLSAHREIFGFWTASSSVQDRSIFAEFTFSAFIMLHGALLLGIGFWKRAASIRWQGLALLFGASLKVFLYDMRSLSQGYRVLSFIGLGALLMAVSFAYQKDWLGLRATPSTPTEPTD